MNIKRMHGRSHRAGNGGGGMRHIGGSFPLNRNHVFDSNGPDLRLRGTAQQLFEKYLQLGREAAGGGDRVMSESYFQYAEHYFRIVNVITQAQQGQIPPPADAAGTPRGPGGPRDHEARDIPIGGSPAAGFSL